MINQSPVLMFKFVGNLAPEQMNDATRWEFILGTIEL